jgi:hypothetical protein
MIRMAERRRSISGMVACRGGPVVSHLLFADDSIVFCHADPTQCQNLLKILEVYEKASGQAMNREKTALFFSKNTSSETKDKIMRIVGVNEIKSHEQYLGLPSIIGRSKKKAFDGLKDRLWKRLNGWQENYLSIAGKETLIKAVAQAIPIYTMQCFLLPKSFCYDLNSMVSKFWWGQQSGKGKIHWLEWGKLCKAKDGGGLGFRDLHLFNLALLAKQGWRLLQNPHSLVARVLKAKYYPSSSFLNAKLGHNPSFTWRSIWNSRETLQLGLQWRVGDGNQISIWDDWWIPTKQPHLISSPVMSANCGNYRKVAELIEAQPRRWKNEVLNQLFSGFVTEKILTIPLSYQASPDKLIWAASMSGIYCVKSAYYLLKDHSEEKSNCGEASNGEMMKDLWSRVWHMHIPPKVKNFVWRACLNILPTKANLKKKKITSDGFCPICESDAESTIHALWECPAANDVWLSSNLRVHKMSKYQGDLIKLVLSLFDKVGEKDCGLVVFIMWYIWFNRNRVVHENKMWDPNAVVAKAESHLEEFIKASSRGEMGDVRIGNESPRLNWKAPEAGMVKINWDVIKRDEDGSSSRGIIIRDSEGQVVAAVSSAGSEGGDLFARRLLCLTRALMFAREIGFFDVEIDIEDTRLFQALISKSLDNSRWGHLIVGIRLCLQSCARWKLTKIPKFCNSAAKLIARMVKPSHCFDVWLEDYPLSLRDVILRELPL